MCVHVRVCRGESLGSQGGSQWCLSGTEPWFLFSLAPAFELRTGGLLEWNKVQVCPGHAHALCQLVFPKP